MHGKGIYTDAEVSRCVRRTWWADGAAASRRSTVTRDDHKAHTHARTALYALYAGSQILGELLQRQGNQHAEAPLNVQMCYAVLCWSCNQKCYYHTPFFARTPPNEPANVVSVFSSLPTTRVRALRAVPLPLRMVVVGSNCFVPVLTTPAQAHALERALKQLLQGEAQGGSGGCPAAVGGQQR